MITIRNKTAAAPGKEKHGKKVKVSTILTHMGLILLVIINIFPLYWMMTFSLKSNDEIQGYKKAAEQTRWEEIESAIMNVTGDVADIEWQKINRSVIGSVGTCVNKDTNLTEQEKKARQQEIEGILNDQWDDIQAAFSSIEGFLADEKTDEDWAGIRADAEAIVNDAVRKRLPIIGIDEEPEPAEETAEEETKPYRFTFSFTNNKWRKLTDAVARLNVLANPEAQDPWDAVKSAVGNVMGDMADTLDEPETVYVPPNHIGLPRTLQWSNYSRAMETGNMGLYFLNSLIVAASAIFITMIAAFMATYAMTRLVWKGRKAMNKFFMLGLTIPIHAAVVPVYIILSRLHWLNTYQALIIPYAAFSLSMAILISVGFMGDIPYDLDEAAFLDGCGVWGIFCRVIAPLMMPAIATVGIYTFLQCWNELLFATIFVSSGSYRTLPVGVQQLFGQYTTDWGPIGAALAIATIPTMIVYILLSKRIQAGFIAGAVKG